jgi:hypothetical protein
MGTTRQLLRHEWKDYFDRFTRAHLATDGPGAATLELISPALGDQIEASAARLLGLTYDPKNQVFEVAMEDLDHLVFRPSEIWVLEDEPGLVSTIEIVDQDGTKEILYVRAAGAAESAYDAPAPD